jgi:hypothetical protein
MIVMGDRVPMFKLRPYRSMLVAAMLVGVVGGLLSAYFYIEDANDDSLRRGLFILILTVVLDTLLILIAFSRYGHKHLHHHRTGYKRG